MIAVYNRRRYLLGRQAIGSIFIGGLLFASWWLVPVKADNTSVVSRPIAVPTTVPDSVTPTTLRET